MNVFVRLAGDVPTIQKSLFRNAVALVVALFLILKDGQGFRPEHKENLPWLIARSTFGTLGLLANFYAVDHLLLADASMLNKMAPFFAVIASFFLLKEKISPTQALTLVGAFVGALFIVKPSFGNMDLIPSLIGLCGGLCAGTAYTIVRLLGQRGERGALIVFFFCSFSCLVTGPVVLLHPAPMTLAQTASLLLAGLAAAGGQFSVTAAYCAAPAREISIYDYSHVIFGTIFGFFLFGDVPDGLSFVGYALICSMAIFSWYRANHPKA